MKENSVNLIFAVTEEQLNVYNLLSGSVQGSTYGQLSADSSNVVQLVKAQYEAITSAIEMKDNATGSVKVFDCFILIVHNSLSSPLKVDYETNKIVASLLAYGRRELIDGKVQQ